jgi:hypothetical protein
LKVGYASSRAHSNNDSNTNIIIINTTMSSCAHDNKQDQSLGFGISYIKLETWFQVLHLSLVFS